MSCSHVAFLLVGPAITPIQQNVKTIHSVPQTDNKGSVNSGGGGGGSGSGCGKKSPCDKSKKKSKSCGGGGGGCGKSKSCGGKNPKFKVVFMDYEGKPIPYNLKKIVPPTPEAPLLIQEVEKGSAAVCPWEKEDEIPDIWKSKYKVPGFTFDCWLPTPSSVESDMVCASMWLPIIGGDPVQGLIGDSGIGTLVTEEQGQKIKDFSDNYLSPGVTTKSTRSSYVNRGKFNLAIDKIVERIDFVTNTINNAMDTLWAIKETCYEGPDKNPVFNDTKKCILNIQSCFIFQCRMTFNLDFRQSRLVVEEYVDPVSGETKKRNVDVRNPDVPEGTPECIYDKINRYTQEMLDYIRNGGDSSKLDSIIQEKKDELDEDIDYYLENNLMAFNEFKETYNVYVDTINSCFPTDPLTKLEIEKI